MRNVIFAAITILFAVSLAGCSSGAASTKSASASSAVSSSSSHSSDRITATADTVFGFCEQYEVKSGSGNSIGTVSVFKANSADCTQENLELWCNQYVRWGIDNWGVVEFTDKPGYGVYASGSIVESGVALAPDYSIADDSNAEFYVFNGDDVTKNGTLTKKD